MMTAVDLANKRTRKALRRRTLRNGRRRNGASLHVGRTRFKARLDEEMKAKMNAALDEQRAESRAAVRAAVSGKKGGFMDGVKSKLFKMLPRRAAVVD